MHLYCFDRLPHFVHFANFRWIEHFVLPHYYAHRWPGSAKVNRGQPSSNEVNVSMTFVDFIYIFWVLLFSNVIWGADFKSDIHFTLKPGPHCSRQRPYGPFGHVNRAPSQRTQNLELRHLRALIPTAHVRNASWGAAAGGIYRASGKKILTILARFS